MELPVFTSTICRSAVRWRSNTRLACEPWTGRYGNGRRKTAAGFRRAPKRVYGWIVTIRIAKPIDDPEASAGYGAEQFLQRGQHKPGGRGCGCDRNCTGNPRTDT